MDGYFIKQGEIGLRCIMPADEETFLRWHNDPKMREKIGGVFPFDRNTFQKICNSYGEQQPADIWFAIIKEDELVGIAGLHNLKYIQRNAEVAIFIGNEIYRRRGIGRNVVNLIVEYAFGTLALHRLYALVYSDNIPALYFFNKCQWKQEGVLKDAFYWNYHFRDVVIWSKINHID